MDDEEPVELATFISHAANAMARADSMKARLEQSIVALARKHQRIAAILKGRADTHHKMVQAIENNTITLTLKIPDVGDYQLSIPEIVEKERKRMMAGAHNKLAKSLEAMSCVDEEIEALADTIDSIDKKLAELIEQT